MLRRLFIIIFVLFLVGGFVFVLFNFYMVKNYFFPPMESGIVLINDVEVSVEIAKTSSQRAQGLSGRDDLHMDHGMLFLFEKPEVYSIWMKDMKFSLDFIWILDGVVVDITRNVPVPGQDISLSDLMRYISDSPCNAVLEVKSGFVQKHNIEVGDQLHIFVGNKKVKLI